jgi:hypothetical protein
MIVVDFFDLNRMDLSGPSLIALSRGKSEIFLLEFIK